MLTTNVVLDEGETTERIINLRNRRLIEYSVEETMSVLQARDKKTTEDWMASNATFIHSESNEFIFWIPEDQESFNEAFQDCPWAVQDAMNAAFLSAQDQRNQENGNQDSGYLLIYY